MLGRTFVKEISSAIHRAYSLTLFILFLFSQTLLIQFLFLSAVLLIDNADAGIAGGISGENFRAFVG